MVEDCAEAHGARYRGKAVGQFGDVSCFSFYANKIVTTGEGGMCVTDSAELATSLRVLRDHGMSPDRSYWHERVGFSYRITNLQAAIGQSQIWRVNEVLQRNARIAALYREALKGIPDVRFPPRAARRVPACRVDDLRAGAGGEAPAADARGPRGQDRDAALLPPALGLAPLRQVRPLLSQQHRAFRHRREPADIALGRRKGGRARRPRVPRRVRVTEEVSAMLSSVIIGGGPGGLGADHMGGAARIAATVARSRRRRLVERQAQLGGTLGRFGIHSDSLGGSYLECLEAAGLPPELKPLRDEPVAHEMAHVSRQLSAAHPGRSLHAAHRHCRSPRMLAKRSALHLCTEACAIHRRPDGSVEVEITGPDGRESVLAARSAVVALGGRQRWMQGELRPGLALGDLCDAPCHAVGSRPVERRGSRKPIRSSPRPAGGRS